MKNIKGKTISIILCLALVFGSTLNVFASSTDYTGLLNQALRTTSNYYWRLSNGNNSTISTYTYLANLVAQGFGNNSEHLYSISSKLTNIYNNIKDYTSYLDGIEGYIDGLETALTTNNTRLNSIIGYIDSIEGYIDGIEGKIDTSNTRLSSILSAIQNLAVDFGLETSQGFIWTKYDGTQSTITSGTSITDLLGMVGGANGENFSGLYNLTNNIYSKFNNNISAPYNFIDRSSVGDNNNQPEVISRTGLLRFGFQGLGSSPNYYVRPINVSTTADLPTTLGVINNNLFNVGNFIYTLYSSYRHRIYDPVSNGLITSIDGNGNPQFAYSLMDYLYFLNGDLSLYLGKLQYYFADDDSIAAKKANQNQEQSVLTNFTGNGSASASVSDFTGAKDSLNSVKNGLATGTNISNILNIYNSDDGYSFFSQSVANDINGVSSSTNSTRYKSNSVDSYYTPLLDEKMNALYSVMGVINGK